MSTSLIWIIFPLIISGLLALISSKRKVTCVTGSILAFLFGILATLPSEDLTIRIGSFSLELSNKISLLGRTLEINSGNLPLISFIFFIAGLWIMGSGWFKLSKYYSALVFLISALLIAALAVRPFLYAALLIEIAVLLSIPLLSSPNEKTSPGILRYLIFETMAIPMILLAGWLLSGIETAPANSPLINQITILLLLGFVLLLAVFPFHSWMPMLAKYSHPWVTSFIFAIFPTIIAMLLIGFLDRFIWLRSLPSLYSSLNFISALMMVVGGVLVAIQDNLGKAFGYAVIIETGFSLLAIGLNPQGGLIWFSLLLIPRAIAYWLWAFCLGKIKEEFKDLSISSLSGIMHTHPFLSAGVIIAQLSLAGLPLLASFPIKRLIWFASANANLWNNIWLFISSIGLALFTIRISLQFFNSDSNNKFWKRSEPSGVVIPIIIALFLLLSTGLFPHLLLPAMSNLMNAFERFPILP